MNQLKDIVTNQFNRLTNSGVPKICDNSLKFYRSLPIFLDVLPDINTAARTANDETKEMSYRGGYFLVFMENIGNLAERNYKGPIIKNDSVKQLLEEIDNTGIDISDELDKLENWFNYTDYELLQTYISVLLKIQALKITLRLGIDLSKSSLNVAEA